MQKKHNGAHNELVATVWLLKEGYEVFRNVSPHGDVDIIGMKDGELTLFDVKKVYLKLDGTPSMSTLKASQLELGVKLLCVSPDDECSVVENPKLRGGANRVCVICSAEFSPRSRIHKFCGSECKVIGEAPRKREAYERTKRKSALVYGFAMEKR